MTSQASSVRVWDEGTELHIEIPSSWVVNSLQVNADQTTQQGESIIKIPYREAETLSDLLYMYSQQFVESKAEEEAERRRIRAICADPNTPDWMKFFKCALCGERIRHDDFEHRHPEVSKKIHGDD